MVSGPANASACSTCLSTSECSISKLLFVHFPLPSFTSLGPPRSHYGMQPTSAGEGRSRGRGPSFCVTTSHQSRHQLLCTVTFGRCSGSRDDELGGVPGPCGDPFIDNSNNGDSTYWQTSYECEPRVYSSGGVMSMELLITGHHGGFIQCGVCDRRQAENWSEACFDSGRMTTCAFLLN